MNILDKRTRTEFDILCSARLYKMQSTIAERLNKIINTILLLAGASIFGGVSGVIAVIMGFCIALLTTIQTNYNFSIVAEKSKMQYNAYYRLYKENYYYSDDALVQKLHEIEREDTGVWTVLHYPAILRCRIIRRLPGGNLDPKLTVLEKVVSWLAGDMPKRRLNLQQNEDNN
ncbi:MAG: hypothetical protein EKE20_14775 [Candidatus Symbiopectobacterium sp. Dall1.0]|nr:hypothetical protein [Candidatus Symbiopectobacterium sp. Dall1.0]